MKKIETSALIGLGALGILFGRKMPGVQVIADEGRIVRYAAEPVVCNGEECKFSYVTPAEGKPVDLLLVPSRPPCWSRPSRIWQTSWARIRSSSAC